MNPQQPQTAVGMIDVDQTKVAVKTYYAQLDGCTYYFKNGHQARFEGGAYTTDKAGEQAELDALLNQAGQYLICKEPVELRKSDALILKDVGKGQPNSGVGTVNSAMLAGLGRASGK